jgi:hypothetical protein
MMERRILSLLKGVQHSITDISITFSFIAIPGRFTGLFDKPGAYAYNNCLQGFLGLPQRLPS